ncbi:MAG TPA: response regulator [Dongiaceae bacterium]|jgi:DNA-binding response OmpR family regulator
MAKILLIDDDKEFRGFVAAGLEHKGHKVTVASSGRFLTSGSGKADFGATFDLVITDVLMPDVDGIEVVRMVKAANPKCKVIAMSGGGRFRKSSMLLHLADALGAELTLAKPFAITDLCHTVDGVLKAA